MNARLTTAHVHANTRRFLQSEETANLLLHFYYICRRLKYALHVT